MQAALKVAKQIGFTLVSLTLSLIAVLIPLLFMADVVGRLFREFAITLAVAILISLVVSLTLTPMMCARLLKREPKEQEQGRFYRASGAWIDWMIAAYGRKLQWVLKHQPLTRSEEHTSELQSLMRISYADFCLKNKNKYTK